MIPSKHIGIVLIALIVGALCQQFGTLVSFHGISGFISPAEARVGRPLTPVSVAGVARRTARRCAAGVYYC
jgi:hypothetical protein